MSGVQVEFVYDLLWKERRDVGLGPRTYEYADTHRFGGEVQAKRAHENAKQFRWLQDGWFDGWVSPLRRVDTDLDSRGRRTDRKREREVAAGGRQSVKSAGDAA